MLGFGVDVKSENELIEMLNHGRWDKSIFNYLIEIMSENEDRKLGYDPTELFEMEIDVLNTGKSLYFAFWDANKSGERHGWNYRMDSEQKEFFAAFRNRVNEIHESLCKLVEGANGQS